MKLDICFFGLVICCSIYNAMLFQMDSLPLIDAIIFSVNIYKYKTETSLPYFGVKLSRVCLKVTYS